MSPTLAPELSQAAAPLLDQAVPTRRAGWHERLVLRQLKAFDLGRLEVHQPDGSVTVFGRDREFEGRALEPAEIRLHQPYAFFKALVTQGNIGLGESYLLGDWDSPDLRAVISWLILNLRHRQGAGASSNRLRGLNRLALLNRLRHLLRDNSREGSRRNIEEHYDLGNEFYSLWLDQSMTYSSAWFQHAGQDLEAAQIAKYEALCQRLQLRPGDHVLEIGCGWGGFAIHAATHYGVRVTGVTISPAQLDWARQAVERAGLGDRVELRLQDYRDIQPPAEGPFDKIVSIEMLEAVGEKHLESFFEVVNRVMAPHGLLALQIITVPDSSYQNLRQGVDFIQRHIFPGSLLLSLKRLHESLARTGDLFLHDQSDLGAHYAETLERWHARFEDRIEEIKSQGFDARFIRKWRYYLKYCAAAFGTRNISVVQATFTRPNNLTLDRLG